MNIIINGENKEVKTLITVSGLLEEMNTPAVGIAVEINREIVPRSKHATWEIKDGDMIEIVKMVGGG